MLDWDALSSDYARYHRDRRNRLCHAIGIPLIVFCVVRWTLLPGTTFPLAALVLPLYAFWDASLGLLMAAVLVLMGVVAPYAPAPLVWACFVAGWVFQFVGHKFEGQSPAFLKNLAHVLVGPLWILREMRVAIFLH